jgi:hypothetical protein
MHKKAFAAMSVISYKGTDKKTVKLWELSRDISKLHKISLKQTSTDLNFQKQWQYNKSGKL